MSRNLCRTDCYYCNGVVELRAEKAPITASERGPYTDYDGMSVAPAECVDCLAKYLAWVDWPSQPRRSDYSQGGPFFDLSFRSSFNDEPGPDDLPVYDIEVVTTRTRKPIDKESNHYKCYSRMYE